MKKIDDNIKNTLVARCIFQILSSPLFVCHSLRLDPKNNGRFRKISHLFFQPGFFVNDCFTQKTMQICYINSKVLWQKFVEAGHKYVII